MTLATTASLTPLVECQSCGVSFVGSGRVTPEMFRDRHMEVVHNWRRQADIKNAGRRTQKKIAEQQAAMAERESKRRAKLVEASARKSTRLAASRASAVKAARVKRRK